MALWWQDSVHQLYLSATGVRRTGVAKTEKEWINKNKIHVALTTADEDWGPDAQKHKFRCDIILLFGGAC